MSKSAERAMPDPVPPVTVGGVRYEAPHWGRERGLGQNGGFVRAVEAASGNELWLLQVYQTVYDESKETDVQDVFLTSLTANPSKAGTLLAANERGERFEIDPATRQVAKLPS